MLKRLCLLIIVFMLTSVSYAAARLKPGYPHRYVVKEGDTLWGIADKFLLEPWEWEQLWKTNPELEDPSKIYPGMVIEIRRHDGKAVLGLERGRVVRLSPKVRKEVIEHPIPPIPLDTVRPFLLPSLVVAKDAMDTLPYVIEFFDERKVGGRDTKLYTSEYKSGKTGDKYDVFRPSDVYRDPETREILGYAAEYLGYATLLHSGSPASFQVEDSIREILVGDKLMPNSSRDFPLHFYPHAPNKVIEAKIVSLHGEFMHIGRGQIAVLNKGEVDGVRPGHVLAIYEPKHDKEDPVDPRRIYTIPPERVGETMIFRVFNRVSFGLIMRSTESVQQGFLVTNP